MENFDYYQLMNIFDNNIAGVIKKFDGYNRILNENPHLSSVLLSQMLADSLAISHHLTTYITYILTDSNKINVYRGYNDDIIQIQDKIKERINDGEFKKILLPKLLDNVAYTTYVIDEHLKKIEDAII